MRINEILGEATGDDKFDSMMSRMIKEPRIPDAQQTGIQSDMLQRFKTELDKLTALYRQERRNPNLRGQLQQLWSHLQRQFLDYGYELSMGDFDPNMPNEVWISLFSVEKENKGWGSQQYDAHTGLPHLAYVSRRAGQSSLEIDDRL
jgi:hypothetical protein